MISEPDIAISVPMSGTQMWRPSQRTPRADHLAVITATSVLRRLRAPTEHWAGHWVLCTGGQVTGQHLSVECAERGDTHKTIDHRCQHLFLGTSYFFKTNTFWRTNIFFHQIFFWYLIFLEDIIFYGGLSIFFGDLIFVDQIFFRVSEGRWRIYVYVFKRKNILQYSSSQKM